MRYGDMGDYDRFRHDGSPCIYSLDNVLLILARRNKLKPPLTIRYIVFRACVSLLYVHNRGDSTLQETIRCPKIMRMLYTLASRKQRVINRSAEKKCRYIENRNAKLKKRKKEERRPHDHIAIIPALFVSPPTFYSSQRSLHFQPEIQWLVCLRQE